MIVLIFKTVKCFKEIRTYRQWINEGLLHVVTELVADHAPEHAHIFEGQVVDVQVAVWKNLEGDATRYNKKFTVFL